MIEVLAAVGFGVLLTIISVMVGGWLVFKAKNAQYGEGFLTGVPKGEAFSMKDDLDRLDEPDPEKEVLSRTESFLKTLGG
jgi:hypothetical protein